MNAVAEVVARPSLRALSESILRPDPKSLPFDEQTLRAAIIAETLRIGLFDLYHQDGTESPVHPLSLRAWVRHKLEPVIPHIMEEGEGNFREVLCEGRGANLEFLGDALILTSGYLCPAPTRLVQVGPTSHLFVSGVPSDRLGTLVEHLVHSALGRRVEGLDTAQVLSRGMAVQSLDQYLGRPTGVPAPEELISRLLSRSRSQWQPGKAWEAYAGNAEYGVARASGSYGFQWTNADDARGRRYAQVDFRGTTLSLWKEPLTERFFHYWLAGTSKGSAFGIMVLNTEWKQACLALDFLLGRPREATLVRDAGHPAAHLTFGFEPFEALYRALLALGARFSGWRPGQAQWEVPLDGRESLKTLLERAGVRVRLLGT